MGGAATRPWRPEERAALDRAPLIRIAVARADGTLGSPVLIGHVRVDGDELIRSLAGADGAWFRAARRSERAEVEFDGVRVAVVLHRDTGREPAVDAAYRERYGDDAGVRSMIRPSARDATLRILPAA